MTTSINYIGYSQLGQVPSLPGATPAIVIPSAVTAREPLNLPLHGSVPAIQLRTSFAQFGQAPSSSAIVIPTAVRAQGPIHLQNAETVSSRYGKVRKSYKTYQAEKNPEKHCDQCGEVKRSKTWRGGLCSACCFANKRDKTLVCRICDTVQTLKNWYKASEAEGTGVCPSCYSKERLPVEKTCSECHKTKTSRGWYLVDSSSTESKEYLCKVCYRRHLLKN